MTSIFTIQKKIPKATNTTTIFFRTCYRDYI